MRFLRRLFAVPSSEGAAPAPAPLPELAPMPGTSAFHQRRAHRYSTATHMSYGRWMVGRSPMSGEEIAVQAEIAATEWALFSLRLREELASVDVPNSPEGLS